jgi:hypothetical protein
MQYQEQIDGDKVFTGNVEILGQIQNDGLSRIATEVQKSRTEAQSVKAGFQNFWEAVLADGIVEPTEKITLARTWAEIKTEYPVIRQRAIDIGMASDHAYLVAYETAYSDLVTILEGSGGILVYMDQNSIVDPVVVNAAFEAYQDARETLVSGTIETARDEAILVSGENVASRTPSYFGPVEYPGQPPEPWKKADKYLSFSVTAGDAYRGVFKLVESGGVLAWTRTVDPGDVEAAIRDIADICSRRDDAGTRIYGIPEDYGVSEIAIAHIRLGLIDTLKADEVEVRGTIRAERGYFKGQIEAPPILTEAAQIPGIITPAATRWKGSQLLAAIAALAEGTYVGSGTYDGKTVSGLKKGISQYYHYDSAETDLDSSKEWKTKKTFTSNVSGLVVIKFWIKAGPAATTVHGRIVKAGIQVAAISTTSKDYVPCSVIIAVTAGEVVHYQAKGDYILWAGSQFKLKEFGISVASNSCGVDFSGSPSQVIETNTYYTTDGTIEIPSESISFNAGWAKGYFQGTALLTALQAAGGSVYQRNDLEPNGWSEVYSASITNNFSGKNCTSYEIESDHVLIFNTDGTTTVIYYDTMYAYSAANKLYPTSRGARCSIGGYQYERGSDAYPIMRLTNTNPMHDNAQFSVFSLNAPRVNHDPIARFESTWAKSANWYLDGVYHEYVSDDSFHNLVEEWLTETVSHDASLKRFTRISGNFHRLLDDKPSMKVSGYSGAYIGNNGTYYGLDVHTLYVDYTTFVPDVAGQTPVTAPALTGISIANEVFAGSTTKISIDASAKTITRSNGTFSRNLIGLGEYLYLWGFSSPYSGNNGYFRIVEQLSATVLKYDVTMGTTPATIANHASTYIQYPIRHVHAILNHGDRNLDLHKPRVQWGYLKNDLAYEFGMEYSHATKRFYTPNGRRKGGNVHAATTSGSLFTTLNAVLQYVGEDIVLHGGLKYTTAVEGPPGDWTYTDHRIVASYAVKLSATVIRIYGLDYVASGGDLGQFDATSGSSESITVSISW